MEVNSIFLLDTRHDKFFAGRSKRLTRRTLRGSAYFLLFFVFLNLGFLLAGFSYLYDAITALYNHTQITRNGQDTQATVIKTEFIEGYDEEDRYLVTYRFNTENYVITNVLDVSHSTFTQLAVGSPLDIRYWVDDPSVSFVASEMNDVPRNSILALLGGIFLLVPGVLITFFWLQRYFKLNRLAREGRIIEGEVVSAAGEENETGYEVTLKYKYRRDDGTEVQESAAHVRNDLKHKTLPEAGTKLAILYINDELLEVL